jgi:hypothetical protein
MDRAVALYLCALAALLLGYMFFGRGFAHISVGPVFIGDVVMLIGIATAIPVVWKTRGASYRTLAVGLLVAFMVLGAGRTLPYVGTYGTDSLRDGVLWGYGLFALIVVALADRWATAAAFSAYRWILPVFAAWLPISYFLFTALSADIDPNRPGAVVPFVFFKAGDMAVHVVGAIAALVVGRAYLPHRPRLEMALMTALFLLLLWTLFTAGTANRGALVTATAGLLAILAAAPRSPRWRPFFAAIAVGIGAVVVQTVLTPLPVPSSAGPRAAWGTAEPSSPSESRPPTMVHLKNSSFEATQPGLAAFPGWEIRGAPPTVASGDAPDGSQYAELENVHDRYAATLRSDRFAVDRRDIAVSLYAKAVSGEPAIEVYVNWYDDRGAPLGSTYLNGGKLGNAWTEQRGFAGIAQGAAQADLLLYEAAGMATAAIDDVTVRLGDFVPDPIAGGPDGRPATIQQLIDNILSLFGSSDDGSLEGTKQFRLAWWGDIVNYTVFGDHFWTGKGFGVNLADDDGYQSTADGSLRAPHNSHLTVLARMGVPGLALWLLLQGTFALGLLRAIRSSRRHGDARLAAAGAFVLVYWLAMMVDTSFDPYLEGPQGGIWFWSVFGLGLVITRLASRDTRS